MTLSEVGTSFSDILTALPIVAGCILILSADGSRHGRYVLAGLLIGAAVGLKLTNVVYALGAAAAVLAATRPLTATLCLGVGGAVGALATGGAWGLMLWRELGNPIFPLFNAVFRSPELVPMNIMDWQFMPRGYLDALAYPFYWLLGDNRSSEYPFRDARFAVAMVLILFGIGRSLIIRAAIFTQRDIQFLLFFAVSYATWLILFAIQRYAIVLELLCAPLIVLLISRCLAGRPGASLPRASAMRVNSVMAATAVLIALWSQPGDWFRRPWSNPYNPAISKPLDQPAAYFLLDKPLAYIATGAAATVAVLPDRRHRDADRAGRRVRPPHSHRAEQSAAGRRMGTAHARQTDPRTIAGAIWPSGGCFQVLRRDRGRVARDRDRGVPAGCAREVKAAAAVRQADSWPNNAPRETGARSSQED